MACGGCGKNGGGKGVSSARSSKKIIKQKVNAVKKYGKVAVQKINARKTRMK